MPDDTLNTPEASQLNAWHIALAAQESERARVMAKYNQRITELKKAIKTLEKSLEKKSKLTKTKKVGKKSTPSG